ncbi:MAG: DUF72 domain-containing protein, partial [Candidatus Aminicenantes bacterium]|nr:DUF72 domain-containing protein [Candidatus Aminicenantes bacterium]
GKERYNYLNKKEELAEWTPKVKKMADITDAVYVFFNNCHAGQAVLNARMMEEILGLERE